MPTDDEKGKTCKDVPILGLILVLTRPYQSQKQRVEMIEIRLKIVKVIQT